MGNHYHLVVETPLANLSHGMRQLNGVYTQRVNRRYGRTGHLLQGRFHAVLVEKESHLLELARYVVLNPVRAGLVASPEQWRWSSYRAVIGAASAPSWLDVNWTVAQFGGTVSEGIARYVAFVKAGVGVDLSRDLLESNVLIGGKGLREVARRVGVDGAAGNVAQVRRVHRRAATMTLIEYEALYPDRRQAIVQAYASGVFSMGALAAHFCVHRTTVAKFVQSALGERAGPDRLRRPSVEATKRDLTPAGNRQNET
jgi:putative transposase